MSLTESVMKAAQAIEYPAGLYQFSASSEGIDGGFDGVTDAHVQQFHEQGYLVVRRAFSQEVVQQALDGLLYLMDGNCQEFRGIQFEPKLVKAKDELTVVERRDAVRKLFNFVAYDPRLKALAEDSALIGVLSRLVNDAPLLFQDMALCKPPNFGSEKPWHQDCAYFNVPLGTAVVGVWIALDRADAENGCMHIIPGSHREGPKIHFKRRDWQICDTDVPVQRDVMAPLEPGGCLFFHGLLHHGTPANRSNNRRRALQFHYKPRSAGAVTTEERMQVFGSEGKSVTC